MEILTLLRAQWDRALAVALTVAGAIVLVVGWVGVSGAEAVVKQMPYITSAGVSGIVLVAMGSVLWVSADLRDQWRELRLVRTTLQELAGSGRPLPALPPIAGAGVEVDRLSPAGSSAHRRA
ncbi:hypothetical protein [Sporichthya polymorpha]|uniref:hypothetical protein n=1 Tax=Sporichthya polymorpha TaxID=35751 RepID=UPI00036EEC5D|nr:hypothetical protein [Sporichthya polymorpha]